MRNQVLVSVALLLTVALSGCGGGGDDGSPTPTGTRTTTTGTGGPGEPLMPPVPISQTCKLTYQANNAPTGACALTVTVPAGFANFTSLSVRLWANATGQCWVVGAETRGTPPTEALPLIRFTAPAPSTEKIEYVSGDLPPKPGGCSTTANSNIKGGPLGTEKTIARPPTGTYTFFNEGLRGQNVEVTLVIVAK